MFRCSVKQRCWRPRNQPRQLLRYWLQWFLTGAIALTLALGMPLVQKGAFSSTRPEALRQLIDICERPRAYVPFKISANGYELLRRIVSLLSSGGASCSTIEDFLWKRTELSMSGYFDDTTEITDITAIGYLRNLEKFTSPGRQIENLSPLANLTRLEFLDLDRNPVSDLAPLAGLTSLQTLYLQNARISDLMPLANLTGLQELYLLDNQIRDLRPLSGLTQLENLGLSANPIWSLSSLANLNSLKSLYPIWLRRLKKITPLKGLDSTPRALS